MATNETLTTDLPIAPGEYLEEVLEELGMSKTELAARMSRPLSKLSAVFSGKKAVTPDTALQLERATGVAVHIWTGLESEYRLAQARAREVARAAACSQEAHLVTTFCYSHLAKLGYVSGSTKPVEKVRGLQDFFGVMSLNAVRQMPRYKAAFRVGASARAAGRSEEALAAWLRVGELAAQRTKTAPFDTDGVVTILPELRALTRERVTVFPERLRELLASVGVAVVFCPHFPKTKAHGATFFLNPETAVLMLTLRCKWADILWFSLFHELGHIVRHGRDRVIVEGAAEGVLEAEADAFARDALIPPADWKTFTARSRITKAAVGSFARDQGIAPGIVVGRRHQGMLYQSAFNDLRKRYEFSGTEGT